MSPVSLRRFLVSVADCEVYELMVEAVSRAAAIKKAKRVYLSDGLGNTDAFQLTHRHTGSWKAEPIVWEVQR